MANITVSMFNVGFGDCFLVEIPFAARTCRILFDCGRHRGGKPDNQALADRVIAALGAADGAAPRIDLVVATHRHKDHVSGFASNGWDKVEVGEVWMPWTENPSDPDARGLVERQVASAGLASRALQLALDTRSATASAAELDAHRQALDLLSLALTNEDAMGTLYTGFAGTPARRYLPDPADPKAPLRLDGIPGLRFHVMGPSRDADALAVMDPPSAETFRHLAMAGSGTDQETLRPFGDHWLIDTAGLTDEQRAQIEARLSPAEAKTIQGYSAEADPLALAAKIDNAINNTSLVIMIEAGAARLLFCADAQWGNWKSILADQDWCDLIRETTFLKVGHHASHNASPVTLIDKLLPKDIPAMVSVDPTAYSSVPYPGLLTEMEGPRGMNVVRSDEPDKAVGVEKADDTVIVMEVPF